MSDGLKWSAWNEVMRNSYDKPTHDNAMARRVCLPLVAGVAVAAVLVLVYPPFACAPVTEGQVAQLSPSRVCCWALLAAVATALLACTDLFKHGRCDE